MNIAVNKRYYLIGICFIIGAINSLVWATPDRWSITKEGAISWKPENGLPHTDHLEMSGQQLSVVLRYGVDVNGAFLLERSLVFPMLRLLPNETTDHLQRRIAVDVLDMITANGRPLSGEKVEEITFNGIMTVQSSFGGVRLKRLMYPSTSRSCYCEEYAFTNPGKESVTIDIPAWKLAYVTPQAKGVYGAYSVEATLSKTGAFAIQPGETFEFHILFEGRKETDATLAGGVDIQEEKMQRQSLINQWWENLVLETPDSVLNRMFAFAKIRGAESIFRTKGGLLHGPGGEAYYAAIWANDQAEYINPFFPFLGYETGNESALNSFRHFARFMNHEYLPIPSSIISEGVNIWHGAKDRGDGAMIAYGAARYALAYGDREEAKELWPLIEWCLEYCHRQLNAAGVVKSNSDELENRFPAGEANLCTSSLYYDALRSAVFLGRDLGVPSKQLSVYSVQASQLRQAIEKYFGAEIEGFQSYRYYDGNEVLRSWICMPLTVGIYERAGGTVEALFSPRLWTNDGLLTQAGTETFWDRSTLYALRGTMAAGDIDRGMDFLVKYSRRRLLGDHVPYAIEAWPEGNQRHLSAESGLYCRIYTEGLFGIRPTGLRSFELTPRLPKSWQYANLNHIRAFGSDFDIQVKRAGANMLSVIVVTGKKNIKKVIREGTTLTIKL